MSPYEGDGDIEQERAEEFGSVESGENGENEPLCPLCSGIALNTKVRLDRSSAIQVMIRHSC